MDSKELEEQLNRLYWSDPYMYRQRLEKVKAAGYKVYRNKKGEHKLENVLFSTLNDIMGGKL